MIGASDAGAHVLSNTDSCYAVWTLQHWVRDRGVLTLEHAVRKLTADQADLLGFTDRGRVLPGYAADLVLFDPDTVGTTGVRFVADQPAGGRRLVTDAYRDRGIGRERDRRDARRRVDRRPHRPLPPVTRGSRTPEPSLRASVDAVSYRPLERHMLGKGGASGSALLGFLGGSVSSGGGSVVVVVVALVSSSTRSRRPVGSSRWSPAAPSNVRASASLMNGSRRSAAMLAASTSVSSPLACACRIARLMSGVTLERLEIAALKRSTVL